MKDALYSLDFHTDRKDELAKAILIKNPSVHVMSSLERQVKTYCQSRQDLEVPYVVECQVLNLHA